MQTAKTEVDRTLSVDPNSTKVVGRGSSLQSASALKIETVEVIHSGPGYATIKVNGTEAGMVTDIPGSNDWKFFARCLPAIGATECYSWADAQQLIVNNCIRRGQVG